MLALVDPSYHFPTRGRGGSPIGFPPLFPNSAIIVESDLLIDGTDLAQGNKTLNIMVEVS